MPIKRALRRPEVKTKTGLSYASIFNFEKAGLFPRHFMLSPRCAAWDEAEVDAYLAARKAAPGSGVPTAVTNDKVHKGGRPEARLRFGTIGKSSAALASWTAPTGTGRGTTDGDGQ